MTGTAAQSDLLRSSIIAQTVPNYGTLTNITEPATDNPLPVLSPPVLLTAERRLSEQQTETQNRIKALISNMLTVASLILQYLFMGIVLGLRTSSPIKWYCLAVSCMQNCIITFSASSDLVAGSADSTYITLTIAMLSIISPVGVIISMFRTDTVSEIPPAAKGTIAAVACGTLIYTTFSYVLTKKGPGSVIGMTKFSAIILGAFSMAVLQYAVLTL